MAEDLEMGPQALHCRRPLLLTGGSNAEDKYTSGVNKIYKYKIIRVNYNVLSTSHFLVCFVFGFLWAVVCSINFLETGCQSIEGNAITLTLSRPANCQGSDYEDHVTHISCAHEGGLLS